MLGGRIRKKEEEEDAANFLGGREGKAIPTGILAIFLEQKSGLSV